jgi:cilia- and flagella-associated protein 52
VWQLGKQRQDLEASEMDPVISVIIKSMHDESVSASSDSSCIIWSLATFECCTSLLAKSFFMLIIHNTDKSQLVTTGTDRKVGNL